MKAAAFLLFLAASLPAGACAETGAGSVLFKVQVGGHLLLQKSRLVPAGVPQGHEDRGGVLGSTSLLVNTRPHVSYGIGMDIEGNRADIGDQVFGIATIRAMAQAEFRKSAHSNGGATKTESYALVGLGWNFNSVGSKVEYLKGGAPVGTALELQLENSPALKIGVGFRGRVTKEGLLLGVEGGWQWNRGSYRMTFSGSPERPGRYNLSGLWLALGIGGWIGAAGPELRSFDPGAANIP